jgi:hypothetical protein
LNGNPAPCDRPVQTHGKLQQDEMERKVAPYVMQARRTYPDAKRRFLDGLAAGHHFFVSAQLRSADRSEVVFIAVSTIEHGEISGTIASEISTVAGYQQNDPYRLPETEIVDWTISHPDGTEEGNFVGKYLETLGAH